MVAGARTIAIAMEKEHAVIGDGAQAQPEVQPTLRIFAHTWITNSMLQKLDHVVLTVASVMAKTLAVNGGGAKARPAPAQKMPKTALW